jgi:ribosomal protein L14E/L6E/L27E
MALLTAGRVCRVLAGQNAGEFCVIVGGGKDGKYEVVGLNIKKTKMGLPHLEPTPTVLEIKAGASEEAAKKALENAGLKTSI